MRSETAAVVSFLFLVMLSAFVLVGDAALPWVMIVGGLGALAWLGYRTATVPNLASHSDESPLHDDQRVTSPPHTIVARTVPVDAPTQPGSAWGRYDDEILESTGRAPSPSDAAEMIPGDAPSDAAEMIPVDAPSDAATIPVDAPSDAATIPVDAPSDAATIPVDAPSDAAEMTTDADPSPEDDEEMTLLFLLKPSSSSADASPADHADRPDRDGTGTTWEQDASAVPLDTMGTPESVHAPSSPSIPLRMRGDILEEDHGYVPVRSSAPARRHDHHVRAALDLLSDTLGDSLHDVIVAAEIPYGAKRAGHVVDMTVWVDYASVHRVHAALQDAVAHERVGWFQWRAAQPGSAVCHGLDIWRSMPHSSPHAHGWYGWVPLGFVVHGGKKRTFAYPLVSRKRLAVVVDDHADPVIRDALLDVQFMVQRIGGRLQWLDERTCETWRSVLPDITVYDARAHPSGTDAHAHVVAAYASDARQFRAAHLEALDSASAFLCFIGREVQALALEHSWALVCDDGGERRLMWERNVWTMKRMSASLSPA